MACGIRHEIGHGRVRRLRRKLGLVTIYEHIQGGETDLKDGMSANRARA